MISALTALGKQIVQIAKSGVTTPRNNFYHRTVVVQQKGVAPNSIMTRVAVGRPPSKTFRFTIPPRETIHAKIEDAAKIQKN